VRDLQVFDDRNLKAVRGVSFDVRAGEIVGIAGVEGNGQRELVEAIVGLRPAWGGEIQVKAKNLTTLNVRQRREVGVSCVPEDRYVRGVALPASIEDNLIVSNYFKPPIAQGPLLKPDVIARHAQKLIETFDVRTPSKDVPAYALSGGNLQKVVLARELSAQPDLFIAAQPTRGLDIGSIEFVHRQIVDARDHGAAVLLVSAELEEIMSLSDRIVVLYEGKIMGTIEGGRATEEGLGLWMAGITSEGSPEAAGH
jgi:simple sugar transport system ATP-binding protein